MAAREYGLEIDAIEATLISIEKVLDLPKLRAQSVVLEVEAGIPNLLDDTQKGQKGTSRFYSGQAEINKLNGDSRQVVGIPNPF